MKSSYNNTICFGDLIENVVFLKKPKSIIEIGILEGYSLKKMADASEDSVIRAYDIFDKFNGNGANKDVVEKFKQYENVSINDGDFYEIYKSLDNNSVDLLHIDIANNGDVYDFVFKNYLEKISNGGTIILEGGSHERDNIDWMLKYNKPKIQPIIELYKKTYNIKTFGVLPSITIVNL